MHSADEMIEAAAQAAPDGDERWRLVSELHRRGDADAFRAAAACLESADPGRRALGADVLAQLGALDDERPFREPAADLLLDRIRTERDPAVLDAIATAFGHLEDPRAIPALHALRAHPSLNVRHAVVVGLLGHDDDLAVATLIELSRDPDELVRDWATFGLAVQIDRDDADVRAALVARLDDEDAVTRAEALRGLAGRGDLRALPVLLAELERGPIESAAEEALVELAVRTRDARLRPHVSALAQAWTAAHPDGPERDDLHAALAAYAPR